MTTRSDQVFDLVKKILSYEEAAARLRIELARLVGDNEDPRIATTVAHAPILNASAFNAPAVSPVGLPPIPRPGVPRKAKMGTVPGSVPYLILSEMRKNTEKAWTATELHDALKTDKRVKDATSIYSNLARLTTDGQLERVGTATYRLVSVSHRNGAQEVTQ